MTQRDKEKKVVGFQVIEDACIWMKAGVVNFRKCDNDFDCATCPFDKAMRRSMRKQGRAEGRDLPEFAEELKKRYPGANRPCRHALTGRVDAPKICPNNYECYHCPYDQMLDEMDLIDDISAPNYHIVAGYQVADAYYYHTGHTWARFEHSGRTRVGFDDFFAKLFGTPDKVELPPLGAKIRQNEPGLAFGRDRRAASVLAPVTGRVLAVNQHVQKHPEIAHEDPYRNGWLFIVEPDMPKKNLRHLLFGKQCDAWIEEEQQHLLEIIDPKYKNLAATGGQPVDDVFGNVPDIGWERIVSEFLRTSPEAGKNG
ncbi:MAG TPA: glycine cleavage system protein H [Desulfosalsimonadaceae bacterium]|nr:glycine cleavage system protein H [Desulfosalsimonadaceae bacterium]